MFAVEHTHRRRRSSVISAAVSAAVLVATVLIALSHGSAAKRVVVLPPDTAVTEPCGATVTTSIVLAADMHCESTSSNGLNVGAPSIIINLNGHTLFGNTLHVGVENLSFPGVTIENGTVTNWVSSIDVGGTANKITGIKASGSGVDGINVQTTATGSALTGNLAFLTQGPGISVGADKVSLTNNVVRQNGAGITVFAGTGDVVATNQVENNFNDGITDNGVGATFSGNVVNDNGTGGNHDGINTLNDPTASLKANTTNYNTNYGIRAYAGNTDGGGNLAKGNTQGAQCQNVICS